MKKKPTKKEINSDMKDIRIVLSRLLIDIREIKSALGSYIEFKNDTDKWTKWLNKQSKGSKTQQYVPIFRANQGIYGFKTKKEYKRTRTIKKE